MGSDIQKVKSKKQPRKASRPKIFWALWLGYAAFTFTGWNRFAEGFKDYYWLQLAGIVPGPDYIIFTGALWGVAGLIALYWMGLARNGYRLVGYGVALFFAATYWADRLLFSQSMSDLFDMPFAILTTLIGLLAALLVLQPFFPARASEPHRDRAAAEQARREQSLS